MRRMRRYTSRVLALVLAAVLTVALTGCGAKLPDLTGMPLEGATAVLGDAGIKLGDVTYDASSTEATWTVISQTPLAGERLDKGASVALVLAGAAPVSVPDLTGLDRSSAEATLVASGLAPGTVIEVYDETSAVGLVVSQDTSAGAEVPGGVTVSFTVSKGRKPVPVPNVVGKAESEARSALESSGFAVTSSAKDDEAPKGTVIAQKPAGGEAVPGSNVAITVSTGVVMVKVPNVLGMYLDDAAGKLRQAGLRVKENYIHGPQDADAFSQPIGAVYRQTPKAGTSVPKGTTVEIRAWWEAS